MNIEHRAATSLHHVRDFLLTQGDATPQWSTGAEAVDALYALLRERRDDEAFWSELAGLLERLEDSRVRPDLIRGADVLGGAAVGQLLAELRAALPAADAPSDVRSWISASSSAGVLAALLLLGSAVGCVPQLNGNPSDDDDAVETCDEAIEQGYQAETADVYCELIDLVRSADTSISVREDVLDCLPTLSAEYRESLLALFRTYDEETLAEALQALAWSDDCDPGWDDDDAEH